MLIAHKGLPHFLVAIPFLVFLKICEIGSQGSLVGGRQLLFLHT